MQMTLPVGLKEVNLLLYKFLPLIVSSQSIVLADKTIVSVVGYGEFQYCCLFQSGLFMCNV